MTPRFADRGARLGAPPVGPPDDPFLLPVDEGPMRGDLLRQIALLEADLTRLVNIICPWEPRATNPQRGPALLDAEALEQIRDELFDALAELRRRVEADAFADLATVAQPPRRGLVERLRALLRRRS